MQLYKGFLNITAPLSLALWIRNEVGNLHSKRTFMRSWHPIWSVQRQMWGFLDTDGDMHFDHWWYQGGTLPSIWVSDDDVASAATVWPITIILISMKIDGLRRWLQCSCPFCKLMTYFLWPNHRNLLQGIQRELKFVSSSSSWNNYYKKDVHIRDH